MADPMTDRAYTKLVAFAKAAGVSIHSCDPEWGGRISYKEKDFPDTAICGFRSERAAYKHWLESTFGATTGKAVLALLRKSA